MSAMDSESKTKKHPSDLSAVDLIKYLNGRRCWHGNQYRSVCGEWLRKAEIRRDALRELASESHCEAAESADEKPDGQAENA